MGDTIFENAGSGSGIQDGRRRRIDRQCPDVLARPGMLYATVQPGTDAFLAKPSPDGSLVYSTYLGGGRTDSANAIAVPAHSVAALHFCSRRRSESRLMNLSEHARCT